MIQNGAYTRTNGFGNEADRILPRFYLEDVADEMATQREGRPIFFSQERVELIMPGNTLNVPVQIVTDEHRKRWPDAYAKFKQGQEIAVDGTPLEQWPLLKRAQVLELKAMNLLTVEHVASMPDTTCQRFMGGMRIRALAKAYLDDAAAGALLAEKTAEAERRNAENAELRGKVDELTTLINQMHGELQGLKNAPHPVASTIPGMLDPMEQMRQAAAQPVSGSALDNLPDVPRRGRKPLPRDAAGNIIREAVNG